MRPVVWSIAGSDSGGGAGLQADQRAFDALRVHGCSVVAAITAQNSVAVQRVEPVATELLEAQIDALEHDLAPLVVKTGLLGSAAHVRLVARRLRGLRERRPMDLVIDPVWRASTGADLADGALRRALLDELLPLATACTPNRREAAWLLGRPEFTDEAELLDALPALQALGPGAWVVTGGDAGGTTARDLLLSPQFRGWLMLPRIDTPHHHGSGCTFAAALAGALAQGFCEADAAVLAKMATARALRAGGPAGAGAGPVRAEPGFALQPEGLPAAVPLAGLPALPAFTPAGEIGLYAVVDSAVWVERLVQQGLRTLQLRIKRPADAGVADEIRRALRATRAAGARLFVNDHWALALELGADGVHLGQQDLDEAVDLAALAHAGLQLGLSSHSLWELARAAALRPSYIACGPVHPTQTKAMPWQPQGEHNLAWWSALAPAPMVAIGGLDAARAREAARCGIGGFAVASGLTAAADPAVAVVAYRQAWAEGRALPTRAAPELPRPSLLRAATPGRPPSAAA